MEEKREGDPLSPSTTRRGNPGKRGPLRAVLILLVPLFLFLWYLAPPGPSVGDDAGTDPLEGHREFLLDGVIVQDNGTAILLSQDQVDPARPFSFDFGGVVGAPISYFHATADHTRSHSIAWGRDGKGDLVLEVRAFHSESTTYHDGHVSLVVTYAGSGTPTYTLQSFDACNPPAETSDGRFEKSRCVDVTALDIDGDGIRDFVIVYGDNDGDLGGFRAVAVNGDFNKNGKIVYKYIMNRSWPDGTVGHIVPNARIVAGDFLGDGTPAVAWLLAQQTDGHQPTEHDGKYYLQVCSFPKDFFSGGAAALSPVKTLDQGFDKNLTGECDLTAGNIDGTGPEEILPLLAGRLHTDTSYGTDYTVPVGDVYAFRYSSGVLNQLSHAGSSYRIGGQDASGSTKTWPMWAPARCGAGDIDGDGKDEMVWMSSGCAYKGNYGYPVIRVLKYDGSSLYYSYDKQYDGNWDSPPMSDGIEFDLEVGHLSSAWALPNSANGNLVKEQVLTAFRSGDDGN
jgi:hypothetical protein